MPLAGVEPGAKLEDRISDLHIGSPPRSTNWCEVLEVPQESAAQPQDLDDCRLVPEIAESRLPTSAMMISEAGLRRAHRSGRRLSYFSNTASTFMSGSDFKVPTSRNPCFEPRLTN